MSYGMNYGMQSVRINTKITDEETVVKMVQPVIDFANKHDVSFEIGWDDNSGLVASYQVRGKTSAYCKGMIAEVKQMLKDTFHCKIDVMLYAY